MEKIFVSIVTKASVYWSLTFLKSQITFVYIYVCMYVSRMYSRINIKYACSVLISVYNHIFSLISTSNYIYVCM